MTMNDSDPSASSAEKNSDLDAQPDPAVPIRSLRSSQAPLKKPSLWQKTRAFFSFRSASLRDDLADAIDENGEGALDHEFSQAERLILRNVLKLREERIEDAMVPRADMVAIDEDETLGELLKIFTEAEHSRLPVFDDNPDNIIGMVHIKDFVRLLTTVENDDTEPTNGKHTRLRTNLLRQKIKNQNIARPVLFVPPSKPVSDLLQSMQATHTHMAIVVDEYGGTDGLVTIEDLLEMVVGDIEDEHDESNENLIHKLDDNSFIIQARADLEDVMAQVGKDFTPDAELLDEADTLGGLIFSLVDRIPLRGEIITAMRDFEFEILEADPRRIKRVKLVRRRRNAVAPKTSKSARARRKPRT